MQVRNEKKKKIVKSLLCLATFAGIGLLSACQAESTAPKAHPVSDSLNREELQIGFNLAGKRSGYQAIQEVKRRQQVEAILQQYESYANANPDYVGWLHLEDTLIDEPVVQSQLDGNGYWEYLYKDFYGNDKFAGTLFLDKACSIEEPATDNWMIYGHNMNNGSMFGTLKYYRQEEFWKNHPTFSFITRDDVITFEILGVVQSWVSAEPQGQFEYYYFFDAENEGEFQDFVRQVKENSLYETGVEAEYGDQLITLSTCDSWHEEGRLAVIGRRLREEEAEENLIFP